MATCLHLNDYGATTGGVVNFYFQAGQRLQTPAGDQHTNLSPKQTSGRYN